MANVEKNPFELTEKGMALVEALRALNGQDVTADDVAEHMGIAKASVNGTMTALAKRGIAERVPVEVEVLDEDGNPVVGRNGEPKHSTIKFLKLTDLGMTGDFVLAPAKKAAAAD